MSVTTTQCRPTRNALSLQTVNDKAILSPIPEKTSNRDVVSNVSEISNIKELEAVMERLETERGLVRKLQANRDDKVSISSTAFKEEAISSNTATVVKMMVENTSSCFNQYWDSFYTLYDKVADEYNKWISDEKIKVTKSVECSNKQIGEEEKSKSSEDSKESKSSEDSESSKNSEESKSSEESKNSEESKSSEESQSSEKSKISEDVERSNNHDKSLISFNLDMDGLHRADHKKINYFAQYCRELGSSLLQFKKSFDGLPLSFSAVQYEGWKQQVTHVFHGEIQAYPSQFELVDQMATSDKMKVFLESACKLLSNLVVDLPFLYSENIGEKRKLVENFATTSEAMGSLLQNLYQPLSKTSIMVKVCDKDFFVEDLVENCMQDIFNLVRNFKNTLHGDLPYRRDAIQWAYNLRSCALDMCCC